MESKIILRRSTRISQNVYQNKNSNYELIENTSDNDLTNEKKDKRKNNNINYLDEPVTSADENNLTDDSDYTVDRNAKEDDNDDEVYDDSSVDFRRKRKDGSNNNKNRSSNNKNSSSNSNKNRIKNNNKNKSSNRNKNRNSNNNKNRSTDNNDELHNKRRSIVACESETQSGEHLSDENFGNLITSKKHSFRNNSYLERLNKGIDDDDFDIFKKSSKFDRNKRISTNNGRNNMTEIKLKKRKSVYVESSNSEDSSESDDEYSNESIRPKKKLKKNNKSFNTTIANNMGRKHNDMNSPKNFEDFNLYEKIKKGPKHLHEIIEEIYYNLFNREQNEKVKISAFFLNFLAECSGNEALTWTTDIIDYIDKQVYLYEEISTNNTDNSLLNNGNNNTSTCSTNNNASKDTAMKELITPSTAKSCIKISNIDEIIKDENSFEKVCTFKCEKLEQYLTTDLDNDVLIKSKNENNKSYKAFTNFFSDFSYHFDENYIYEVLYICIWVFSLSVSKYRKIRFASSLASFSILLGLCKKINYINNHEKQSRKQLLAEYSRERTNNKSTKINRGDNSRTVERSRSSTSITNTTTITAKKGIDIEELIQCNKNRNNEELCAIMDRNLIITQLINNINDDRKNLTILNNFLLCTYNILYKNKIRDVFVDIRLITLEYLHYYLQVLTTYFTNRKFTKLLIWVLHDKENRVKIFSLDVLTYLCNLYNTSTNKNFKVVELIYMCKKKLLNFIFDNDYNVRIKTFELILQMSKMKIKKNEFLSFRKRAKYKNINNNSNNSGNKKDRNQVDSSSEYEFDGENNNTSSCSDRVENNNLAIVYDNHNNVNPSTSGIVNILSKREKKIVSNLIWFNNNNKISKIITSLIYESRIKNKVKQNDKKKNNNYFDVEHNETNNEIDRYNIIYITKYLNKNIPTVKHFVHYFDYLTNYNENVKLYTVIDKFITGIREKLDSINNIETIIELLCEDDIACVYLNNSNQDIRDMGAKNGSGQGIYRMEGDHAKSNKDKNKKGNVQKDNTKKLKDKTKGDGSSITGSESNSKSGRDTDSDRVSGDGSSKEEGANRHINKSRADYNLRKCLLHICESSYRNFQKDINELEKNKNKKISSSSVSGISDKNMVNTKLSHDTNKIKKLIMYTFHIIKNSKLLIKLHQTNQEHLLLVFKILKVALHECKHIYKCEEKNNIYNLSCTIMEYFKNDIDSNITFFINNVFTYLKETYEYLFYLLKNFKLPYYSSKYTMNMISLFLSLNDEFLKSNNKLSSDLFFDLYYSYFNNFLDAFLYYRKNYNAEIDCNEEEEYIQNKKNKVIIINENLVHKDKNVVNLIENDLTANITNLVHIYTLCFNYINRDLSNYVERKKNDIKKIDKSIKKVIEEDYFKFIVNEKCQSIFKDNIYLNDIFDENAMVYYDQHFLQNDSEQDEREVDDDKNEDYTEESDVHGDEYDEEENEDLTFNNQRNNKEKWTKKKKSSNNTKGKSGNNENVIMCGQKISNKTSTINKNESFPYIQSINNLYYNSDACMYANIIIHLCLYIIKAKINSIYYYEGGDTLPCTPSSRLLLLCIDQIYIIYENYIYHLCKKRYFFNYLFNFFLKNYNNKGDGNNNVSNSTDIKNEAHSGNNINWASDANKGETGGAEKGRTTNNNGNNSNRSSGNIDVDDLKNLHNLNGKKKGLLKNLFLELNYIYNNIITLRDDFNDVLIFLIKASNNTVLKYGSFLTLMNIAQLENVLLYSMDDLKRYKTLELFLNMTDKGKEDQNIDGMDRTTSFCDLGCLENVENDGNLENIKNMENCPNSEESEKLENLEYLERLKKNYLDINDELNKYKSVSRYVYKEDNVLFNFVTELFKNVENINNDNYNFVNSFLSIDVSVFFPINTYTYIADMCKIYNKDELSTNSKILEMQYMHMTLIIAQFILNCNNINIFNSCLGVLLLIHLNVKNKGLSSIALNFHNKLKKYSIDIFYEVLLCALIGLYTAYINNALEEKDLLLFSTSIASRLGVKIVDKQKLPLCKFIHSCVNCALNLKNQNSFIKYILPYAQKLNLSEYQHSYLKKQILNLIESYNASNNTQIKFENSIFEHMLLIICKKRKLNEEFRDSNYENSYMNLNESIHMNLSKNITNNVNNFSAEPSIKTRRSSQGLNKNLQTDKVVTNNIIQDQRVMVSKNYMNSAGGDKQDKFIQSDRIEQGNNMNINSGENDGANEDEDIRRVKTELVNEGTDDDDAKEDKEEDYMDDDKEDNRDNREQGENLQNGKSKRGEGDHNKKGTNGINDEDDSDNKKDLFEYEKSPSNSTLSNFISLNEDDDNIKLIEEMNYDDKDVRHKKDKTVYEIDSSPKPVRSQKLTKMHVITKTEQDDNINNKHIINKSLNISPKNSGDHSLNSSLNNITDKDNDDISIISEKKDKINYFEENYDDSNSDFIPGMSPMKIRKKKKTSELSTPISYADDLMNF
ncbi:conserved Plasmodium protein, unknown function [Plasmodium malariae]|uniref:SCD domain-containing protein n=1 Tax=Plasmodium malariae TaxID=5858 RepID=A0A1A8W6J5_PLAMA|nr:conserved Plasmodium protein, unknown function [Plasmodium malariae]